MSQGKERKKEYHFKTNPLQRYRGGFSFPRGEPWESGRYCGSLLREEFCLHFCFSPTPRVAVKKGDEKRRKENRWQCICRKQASFVLKLQMYLSEARTSLELDSSLV